jgi:hypothetical protein
MESAMERLPSMLPEDETRGEGNDFGHQTHEVLPAAGPVPSKLGQAATVFHRTKTETRERNLALPSDIGATWRTGSIKPCWHVWHKRGSCSVSRSSSTNPRASVGTARGARPQCNDCDPCVGILLQKQDGKTQDKTVEKLFHGYGSPAFAAVRCAKTQ